MEALSPGDPLRWRKLPFAQRDLGNGGLESLRSHLKRNKRSWIASQYFHFLTGFVCCFGALFFPVSVAHGCSMRKLTVSEAAIPITDRQSRCCLP